MATNLVTNVEGAVKQDMTAEVAEWIEAFDEVVAKDWEQGAKLLSALRTRAREAGVPAPGDVVTPFQNTIPKHDEVPYPGDRTLERRVEALIRWNAMAMVHRQNKYDAGIGGHISTYASQATLLEVGFNHFFRASYPTDKGEQPGDFVYFQGHASPGVYSRAFLEGRLTADQLKNFRHELRETPGLSSYPHPWLMKDFWQFPTVSMGIGPLNAIYQARFMKYLENRGLIPHTERKIWAFVGDGETDEVDTLGAISLGTREKLDNLIFVVNCNLQRLDGPVRGNSRIIDELESVFRGVRWNVIKVIWGSDWDELFARDHQGLLLKRMEECVDGDLQRFKAKDGAYLRKEFFGKYPELLKIVEDKTDEEIAHLHRGGHDPIKIYNAYKRALEHKGGPTVILAMTVKGYGIASAQSRNPTHSEKKLTDEGLAAFAKRFDCGLPAQAAANAEFYRPENSDPAMAYMFARRETLGGFLPARTVPKLDIKVPPIEFFKTWLAGSNNRAISTTMGFVNMLNGMLKSPDIGKLIVPIIPDEGRTFGFESVMKQVGIYAPEGQKYVPHDADMLLAYNEKKNGQILEEGITEAGSMASFTAAGTAYTNYRVPIVPFYMYYSMFGFQRIGDMAWAFADSRGKGFLMGGTAGRTTMLGEGLQHQDGHSHILASTIPTCKTYDPAYVYELAVILQDGMHRMYEAGENIFYYLTMYNEDYVHPAAPENLESVREGILRGLYKFKAAPSDLAKGEAKLQLFGAGPILNEVVRAQQILAEKYNVAADVWSVTSYTELRRDAIAVERWNRLHPAEKERVPYVVTALGNAKGPIVAASDYMKSLPDALSPWLGSRLVSLGTDGFGRSDNREHLRRHFEIDAESIVAAALSKLAREGTIKPKVATQAFAELGLILRQPTQPQPDQHLALQARPDHERYSRTRGLAVLADNPLLPQDRLRELYALMQRIGTIDRRRSIAAREALLAATLIHLSAGDLVSGAADDRTLREVAPKSSAGEDAHDVPQSLRIPLCAGAARGMQTAGTDRLAVAFVEAGAPENGWEDALRWAQRDRLPFLLVVADDGSHAGRRRATNSAPLVWPELTKLGRSLHLPHFPVDGEDAVAVYRVMQETSARARSGGGPSVIWAMLSTERLPARQQPVKRLEAYMVARKIRL